MKDAREIEGYSVYALMVRVGDEEEPELWEIYSNAKACQNRGERIVKGFKASGIEAEYCCRGYTVKEL